MRKLIRIVLFIGCFVTLAGLAVMASQVVRIPWLTPAAGNWLGQFGPLRVAVLCVALLLAALLLVLMVLIVAKPGRRRVYTRQEGMGRIEITRESIASGAGITLQSIAQVRRYRVHVKNNPRPGKLRLAITVDAWPSADLVQLGRTIQQKVAQDLAASLEMPPQKVKIRIHWFDPMTQTEQNAVPRVQ